MHPSSDSDHGCNFCTRSSWYQKLFFIHVNNSICFGTGWELHLTMFEMYFRMVQCNVWGIELLKKMIVLFNVTGYLDKFIRRFDHEVFKVYRVAWPWHICTARLLRWNLQLLTSSSISVNYFLHSRHRELPNLVEFSVLAFWGQSTHGARWCKTWNKDQVWKGNFIRSMIIPVKTISTDGDEK